MNGHRAGMLDTREHEETHDCGGNRNGKERQMHRYGTATPSARSSFLRQPVTREEHNRQHRARLFRGERGCPQPNRENRPRRPFAAHPPAAAEQRQKKQRAGEHLGPPAHVPNGLAHHRVNREKGGRRKREYPPSIR